MVLVNDDLGRMWKEVVFTLFEILSWHLPGGPAENHEKLQ
jgi:hypothetical protein